MYLPALQELVSRGDILDRLTYRHVFHPPDAPVPEIRVRRIRGALLSADCEYDKTPLVYVGEVLPLDEISSGTRGNVRAFRVRSMFPLLPSGDSLPESYVDFRRIYRFDK